MILRAGEDDPAYATVAVIGEGSVAGVYHLVAEEETQGTVLCVFIILYIQSAARHATHAACPGWVAPPGVAVFIDNGELR